MSAPDPEATHDYSRERPAHRGPEQPSRTPPARATAAVSRVRARVSPALASRVAPSPQVLRFAAAGVAGGDHHEPRRRPGSLPQSIAYEDARAQPAVGFFVEILAGAALLAAGGALLALSGRSHRKAAAGREGESERRRAEDSLWVSPPAGARHQR